MTRVNPYSEKEAIELSQTFFFEHSSKLPFILLNNPLTQETFDYLKDYLDIDFQDYLEFQSSPESIFIPHLTNIEHYI